MQQLNQLGYKQVKMLGKGAYGFVFEGIDDNQQQHVFKFSRLDLPLHVQDRLEDEAQMQSALSHPAIPTLYDYLKIKRQSIIHMSRAKGDDLEVISLRSGPLPPEQIVNITIQLIELLSYISNPDNNRMGKPIVHGDIKPSNIVWDESTQTLQLIDWGSSVWAQVDKDSNTTATNVMDLMSSDVQQTNSRMGDIYFIGEEQLSGALSSPRFDEQGMAATIYALASGQSCRYGYKVITACSLGLPEVLAKSLDAMLSNDMQLRRDGADYLFKNVGLLKKLVLAKQQSKALISPLIPVSINAELGEIETVVYGSRKSFLREQGSQQSLYDVDDVQLEKYYKNYLAGMGDTEKAFIAAVSRLGKYPVVGGLAIRWQKEGVYIDSNLTLCDPSVEYAFNASVNNMINLAQGIFRVGIFKSCLFNAKDTLHFEREQRRLPFTNDGQTIPFTVSKITDLNNVSQLHSYFEDGKDPDEYLHLGDDIMAVLKEMNGIHHTGCIIFEVLERHLKIHSSLMLLDHSKHQQFERCLHKLLALLPSIDDLGIAGFMKLPYKDTRFFEHISQLPEHFYPRNPKQSIDNRIICG